MHDYKKCELMLIRHATASVDSAATSGISAQCAVLRFKGGTQIWCGMSIFSDCDAIHSWNVCRSLKSQKILKPPILGVQDRSRSSMLVPMGSSSAVLVMICSKCVPICNCLHARLVDSSRNCAFWRGYPNLMPPYAGLLELSGSKLKLLKSLFNAENFVCRLSWSISSGLGSVPACDGQTGGHTELWELVST